MSDRPILFSAPMIRALLAGTKSQTRRVIKKPAADNALAVFGPQFLLLPGNVDMIGYAPGDRLWVREQFSYDRLDVDHDGTLPPWYWADGNPDWGDWTRPKPSIHMPRWASRLTLTVTEVRVQRLQEISEEDARAEGVEDVSSEVAPSDPSMQFWRRYKDGGWNSYVDTAIGSYASLWTILHGPGSWQANPWVVAVSFNVRKGNIDG